MIKNNLTKSSLGEKEAYLAYSSRLRLLVLDLSFSTPMQFRISCLGDNATHSGHYNPDNSPYPTPSNLIWTRPQVRLCSQVILGCVNLTVKADHQSMKCLPLPPDKPHRGSVGFVFQHLLTLPYWAA